MMFTPRSRGGQIKNLLKLKDGESYTGVFRGIPHTFYQHWQDGRSTPCTRSDEGGCAICKAGDMGGFRFRANVIGFEDGKWVARVFEGGGKVYDQLVALGREYDLSAYRVRISRTGTELKTQWSIMPAKDGAVTAEQMAKIEAVQLNQLDTSDADDSDAA